MKLREVKREIETSGQLDQVQFSVSLSSHLMDMLSSLYSDPIWAIVREYWTNGQDGMLYLKRLGGNPKPLEIHVPNDLEPWFEVKDYGVGMDHDTVWNVYTQYGNSTKNHSNDDVGGLGVGAKVAFCYDGGGDQWTVTAVHDGVKRVYIAAKNDRGMPTLTLLSEAEVDEHNGIAVRVPVSKSDIRAFKRAVQRFAKRALGEFVIKGDVQGVSNGDYDKIEYANEGQGYAWRKNGSGEHGLIAVMGGIPYPVDIHKPELGMSSYERSLLDKQGSADLFFDIGELDIAPSREGLYYTNNTIGLLKARLPKLFQSFTKQFYNDLRQQDNFWDAIKFAKNNRNQVDLIRSRYNKGGDLKWNGLDLTSADYLEVTLDEIIKAHPKDARPSDEDFRVTVYEKLYYSRGVSKSSVLRTKAWVDAQEDEDEAPYTLRIGIDDYNTPRPRFFIADCRSPKTLAREYLNQSGSGRLYLIEGENLDPNIISTVFQGVKVYSLNEHTTLLQDRLEKKRQYRRENTLAPFRYLDVNTRTWDITELDTSENIVYVKLSHNDIDMDELPSWVGKGAPLRNPDCALGKAILILEALKGLAGIEVQLIGVPKTRWDELDEDEYENWEELWGKYRKEISGFMNRGVPEDSSQYTTYTFRNKVREVDSHKMYKVCQNLRTANLLPETGHLRQFYDKVRDFRNEVEKVQHLYRGYQLILELRKQFRGDKKGRTLKKPPTLDTMSFSEYNKWLETKYPLLMTLADSYYVQSLLNHWGKTDVSVVEEYIRSMDRVRTDSPKPAL